MGKQSQGAAVGIAAFGAVGVINKLIGLLYRVPLGNIIGPEGMGDFSMVYPLYTLLITLSTAGLPVAVSVSVAALVSRGEGAQALGLRRAALRTFGWVGLLGTLLLLAFAPPLARVMGNGAAAPGFRALAPSILCVCLISVYRGWLQGHGQMTTTAWMQLFEQVARLAISLPCAIWGMRKGPSAAATAALLGTSVAELLTLLVTFAIDRRQGRGGALALRAKVRGRTGMLKVLKAALPVTAAAVLVPGLNLLDSLLCVRLLTRSGLPERVAVVQYGLYAGCVLTLLNVLSAVALALAAVVAPRIAASAAPRRARSLVARSLRLTLLIALPSALGLMMLSGPLMGLFYPGYPASDIAQAARMLRYSAPSVVLFMLAQVNGAVLQGLGKPWFPFVGVLLALCVKGLAMVFWIKPAGWGILGAPLSSALAYAVVLAVEVVSKRRSLGGRMIRTYGWGRMVLAAGAMGLWIALWLWRRPDPGSFETLFLVSVAALLYGALVLRLGLVTATDVEGLPGGLRLTALLRRLRLLPKAGHRP